MSIYKYLGSNLLYVPVYMYIKQCIYASIGRVDGSLVDVHMLLVSHKLY